MAQSPRDHLAHPVPPVTLPAPSPKVAVLLQVWSRDQQQPHRLEEMQVSASTADLLSQSLPLTRCSEGSSACGSLRSLRPYPCQRKGLQDQTGTAEIRVGGKKPKMWLMINVRHTKLLKDVWWHACKSEQKEIKFLFQERWRLTVRT